MFLDKFFAAIGGFFKNLFSAVKKVWNKVSPEIQDALLKGSGIIATINENLEATPNFIFDILTKKYPNITKEKLQELLAQGVKGIGSAVDLNDPDIVVFLGNIQGFLKELKVNEGTVWAKISKSLAEGIAIFLTPKGTKFSVISQLIEFVYQTFIKNRK